MIDRPIAGPPSVSRERFIDLLAAAGSPAAPEAWVIWDALVRRGVDPLVFAAFFMHESRMGLAGVTPKYDTRNPGNVRSVQNPEHGGVVIQTERGPFVKYASWLMGAQDWADRMRGEKYEGAGLTTVRAVLPKYAPTGDGNDPVAYIRSVLGFIERHRDQPGEGMHITDALTPINHWKGRDGHAVLAIVLHITDGETAAGAISWFRNPASEVSAHYVIDRDGTIYRCVKEEDTAWTNGRLLKPAMTLAIVRRWVDRGINPNKETVSIEAAGTPAMGWSDAQIDAARWLVADIAGRHGLAANAETVIGHMHIDSVTRERCPSLTDEEWATVRTGSGDPSTDALLDAEYARIGPGVLGGKVAKAHLDWQTDWAHADWDVLLCGNGVVSLDPVKTDVVQRLFTDAATEALESAGKLTRH